MRHVTVQAHLPTTTPEDTFDRVFDFERYPDLAPHVEDVTVSQPTVDGQGGSSWVLHFRSGLLRWDESESYDRDARVMTFTQTDGDFESFEGRWSVDAEGEGSVVTFEATFDFGIESLAGILDPIAERVIHETVSWAISGLFDGVALRDAVARPEDAQLGAAS